MKCSSHHMALQSETSTQNFKQISQLGLPICTTSEIQYQGLKHNITLLKYLFLRHVGLEWQHWTKNSGSPKQERYEI